MRTVHVVYEGHKYEVRFSYRLLEEKDLTRGRLVGGHHLCMLRDKLLRDDYSWHAICLTQKTDLLVTQCDIIQVYPPSVDPSNPDVPCFQGIAVCMPEDQFNAAIGRKIALTRALKRDGYQDFKRVVWHAFLNYFGIPRRKLPGEGTPET